MIKFGMKVGVAAGTCYYVAEQGVWKHSIETEKLYKRISSTVVPVLKENLPFEFPALPARDRISYLNTYYWNKAVTKTFEVFQELPDNIAKWSFQGYKRVVKSLEAMNSPENISETLKDQTK